MGDGELLFINKNPESSFNIYQCISKVEYKLCQTGHHWRHSLRCRWARRSPFQSALVSFATAWLPSSPLWAERWGKAQSLSGTALLSYRWGNWGPERDCPCPILRPWHSSLLPSLSHSFILTGILKPPTNKSHLNVYIPNEPYLRWISNQNLSVYFLTWQNHFRHHLEYQDPLYIWKRRLMRMTLFKLCY